MQQQQIVRGPGGALLLVNAADLPNRPPQPLKRTGVRVGELVGWRIWKVREKDALLESYSAGRIWLPGEPMEGEPTDHGPEGVWALREAFHAAQKASGAVGQRDPYNLNFYRWALGTVWLWGEIVEHELGARAQFASVRSLDWAGSEIYGPTDSVQAIRDTQFYDRNSGQTVALYGTDEKLLDRVRRRYRVMSDAEADRLFPPLAAPPAPPDAAEA